MQRKHKKKKKLSEQVKEHANAAPEEVSEYEGNFDEVISTGSTLLDLAISGGQVHGGGIPGGIFVEIFGPSGAGKTVLLCELAGSIQDLEGRVMFKDPEARLDTKFAQLFGMQPDNIDYDTPDTVPEVFKPIRTWQPKSQSPINGIFADSLAALSTDMEMSDDDAYGMRRAKEFSEELRKTCRVLKNENFILVGSNQIRDKVGARQFEEQFVVPGGNALGFYASLRLRMYSPKKIYDKATIGRKTIKHVKGVQTKVQVYKSSIWKPFHEADITIIFDYGIDDIRENLQFIKDIKKETMYTLDGNKLDKSMEESIEMIEQDELEEQLKNEVIHIWNEVEEKFRQDRKPKKRRR